MPSNIPDRWKCCPARDRDILLVLLVDGPASGSELHDRVGGVEGRSADSQTYQAIKRLVAVDLVESESIDERTNEYSITRHGKFLLHRVAEEWEVVLRAQR